jgi:hypothetical protein
MFFLVLKMFIQDTVVAISPNIYISKAIMLYHLYCINTITSNRFESLFRSEEVGLSVTETFQTLAVKSVVIF